MAVNGSKNLSKTYLQVITGDGLGRKVGHVFLQFETNKIVGSLKLIQVMKSEMEACNYERLAGTNATQPT